MQSAFPNDDVSIVFAEHLPKNGAADKTVPPGILRHGLTSSKEDWNPCIPDLANRTGRKLRHRNGLKRNHTNLLIWHVLGVFCYLTAGHCSGYQLVDLTHDFDNDTIYWVSAPRFNLTIFIKGIPPGKDFWVQQDAISAGTHGGTHLDAPCHFAEGAWCVTDIPLDRLVVPTAVVDISRKVDGDPNVHLSVDHLLQWEVEHGQIPDGCLLLIYTGWSKFWPDPLTYSGTLELDASLLKFPSIEPEVARWLLANRKIVGIGLDTMSIDISTEDRAHGVHATLLKENIYGLENLNNLDQLPPRGATVFVMPMKLAGASGAPCMLVAQIPDLTSAANSFDPSFVYIVVLIVSVYILKL